MNEVGGFQCPRCRAAVPVGGGGCTGCGLLLDAEGNLPRALAPDSPWPEAAPPLNLRLMAKGLAGVTAVVVVLLALAVLVLHLLTSDALLELAQTHLERQPEVQTGVGAPMKVLITTGSRRVSSDRQGLLMFVSGPLGLGLGNVEVQGGGDTWRIVEARFRTLSGDWKELPLGAPAPQGFEPSLAVRAAVREAWTELQAGEHAAARTLLDRAVRDEPRWPDGWYWRAVVRRAQGEGAGALADARRALELGYGELAGVVLVGELVEETGLPANEVLEDWDAFLRRHPHDTNARVERALVRLGLSEDPASRATLREACARGHARACDSLAPTVEAAPH